MNINYNQHGVFINKFTTDKISSNSCFNVNEYMIVPYFKIKKMNLFNNDNRKCLQYSINNYFWYKRYA